MMIYLSGKITGDKNFRQKFEKTTKKLLSFGHKVYNPAILPNGFEYEQYMKIDFLALSFCDAIYLLDDWKLSKGAIREFEEAKRLGIKVITEEDSCQQKKKIEKMYKASEQMRELCENYYGINKNDKYILSA